MRHYIASNPAVFGPRLTALGIDAENLRPLYMLAEKSWNEVQMRREFRVSWVSSERDATPFFSPDEAWSTFRRSRQGRESDFMLEDRP